MCFNLKMMHGNIVQEMIEAGIAKFLEEPLQKDHFGSTCEEKKSFGCEVSVDVDHPDYFLADDEVGGNKSKKKMVIKG